MSPVGSFGDKFKVLGLNMSTSGQVDPMDNRDIRDESTIGVFEGIRFQRKDDRPVLSAVFPRRLSRTRIKYQLRVL